MANVKAFSRSVTPTGESSFVTGTLGQYIRSKVFSSALQLAENPDYDPGVDFPGFNANDAYILKRIALYLKGIGNNHFKPLSKMTLIPYNQGLMTPGDSKAMIKIIGPSSTSWVYPGSSGFPVLPYDVSGKCLDILRGFEGGELDANGRYYVYVDVLANISNYTGFRGEFRTEGQSEKTDSAGRSVDSILSSATGALTGPYGLFLSSNRLLPRLAVGIGTKGGASAYINATTVDKTIADVYTQLEMDARLQTSLRSINPVKTPVLNWKQVYGLIRSSWTGRSSVITKYDSENLFRCFAMKIGNGYPLHSIASAVVTMAFVTGKIDETPSPELLSLVKGQIKKVYKNNIFMVRNAPCLSKADTSACLNIIDLSL